jgi:competence protein ComEC
MDQAASDGAAVPSTRLDRARRLRARLIEEVVANAERWPLYAPVAAGVGAAVYFGLRREPSAILALGLPVVAIALTVTVAVWGRSRAGVVGLILLAFAAAGFGASSLRTRFVAAPVVPADMKPATVEGWVVDVVSTNSI